MAPQVKRFPANLLKFNAYIKVTDSIEDAIQVVRDKRLAYGEPCVVTYKNEDQNAPDGYSLHILFGIGTMDPDNPYFFGLYDTGKSIVSVDEFMPQLQKIIDEFYGKELTYIRYSATERPTLTTEYSGGNITLGEAAIKHIVEAVKEDSTDLVTSKGVYNFVTTLIHELEEQINIDRSRDESRINDLDASVSANTIRIGRVEEKVSSNTIRITRLENSVRDIRTDVNELMIKIGEIDVDSYIKDIVPDSSAININIGSQIARIDLDLESVFSEDIHKNSEGKMALFWNSYDEQ